MSSQYNTIRNNLSNKKIAISNTRTAKRASGRAAEEKPTASAEANIGIAATIGTTRKAVEKASGKSAAKGARASTNSKQIKTGSSK